MSEPQKILVVGAGVCGTTAARELRAHGCPVSIVDKGRGAGGRLSTRRTDEGPFNHGAPSFLMSPGSAELALWRKAGLVDTEDSAHACSVIPKTSMNGLLKALQLGLNVQFSVRVTSLTKSGTVWGAQSTEEGLDDFKAVVLAIPSPQAGDLLPPDSELRTSLDDIEYRPQWTVMHGHAVSNPISEEHPDIEKVVVTRSGACAYLTHSASERLLEASPDSVVAHFELQAETAYVSAHRWRYAQVIRSISDKSLHTGDGMFVCGDGFGGSGVEAAIRSGRATARSLLEYLAS